MPQPLPKSPAPGTGATKGYPQAASQIDKSLEGVPADQLLSLTLNGREVKARAGETIMEVCHREDVYVPHYCWHPALSIAGNCRLCLVEVEKVPKPVIACQTPVGPGMVIKTESPAAKSSQEWMMEFLLVNHPLDCPICDRGGECQLQRYSVEYGTSHTRMLDKKRKFIKPQADPLIDIERNRCIMCTRCVRFCDEVGGEHLMGVFDRGDGNYIGTFGQGPVSNIFSGNVIDLCPVGCLTSKPYRFKARPWELKQTQSTCDLCSAGCKVTSWTRNDRLYRTTPPSRLRDNQFTINEDTEEFICNQGRFGSDYVSHSARQDDSLVRRAGRLVPTRFEDAVREGAEAIQAVAKKNGAHSVAFLLSPRATNEEGFLAAKLARDIVKTGNIDWRSSYVNADAADAVSLALDAADGDLGQEVDVVIVVNGNPVHQAPVLALRLQELGRRFDKKIVMLGHHHDAYISEHASRRYHNAAGLTASVLEALAGAVAGDGSQAARLGDLLNQTQQEIASLVDQVKTAGRGLVVHTLEDFSGLYAPAEVPAAITLRAKLGDKWGYLPVVRDRNAVGLHAVGAEPKGDSVPAHELVAAIESGRIKGLVIFGTDAYAALRDQKRALQALAKLDALVVADHFKSDYNENATVVLPLAGNIERGGTYADIEGNIALLKRAVDPAGDIREGWQILTAFGRALGVESFGGNTLEDVWNQLRKALAPASTATLASLELEGGTNTANYVQLREVGGARNRSVEYNPGSYRTDGLHLRGKVPATLPAPGKTQPTTAGGDDDGFLLTWGTHVSGRGYINDRAAIANILLPKPFVEVHPRDAAELKLKTNQFAVIEGPGFEAKVAVKVSRGPAEGTLYLSAGTYGAFDAASNAGPVRVRIVGTDEMAPDQGDELVAFAASEESH